VAVSPGAHLIRAVIALPKTAFGGTPLAGALAPADERQLRLLALATREAKGESR
jgi:hypothetical protein